MINKLMRNTIKRRSFMNPTIVASTALFGAGVAPRVLLLQSRMLIKKINSLYFAVVGATRPGSTATVAILEEAKKRFGEE